MAVSQLTAPVIILNEGTASASATMSTIAAGTNRIVLATFSMYNGSGTCLPPTTIACNGRTPTRITGDTVAQTRVSNATFYFTEADVPFISGQTLTSTGGSGTKSITIEVLQDATQTTPTNSGTGYATTSQSIPISLTRGASSLTIARASTSVSSTTLTFSSPAATSSSNLTSNRRITNATATDSAGTSNFTVTGANYTSAHVFNVLTFPAATINTINGSAFGAVKAASTGNTVTTTSSFTPTSGTHGGKAISSIAGTAGAYTFSAPVYADGVTFPEPDTTQVFALTDGSITIQANSVLSSPDGMESVVLVSPNSLDSTYPAYYFSMSEDDRLVYPTEGGDFEIGDDSGVSTTTAGTRVCWHWNNSTGVMTQLNITVNAAGEVTSVGLTSTGQTSRALTTSGLTHRGL